MKRSKSIELTMKTPDVMIPFDPYSNLRSPIMTPEILQLKPKKISDSKNKLNEENKIELKNDFNEKKEKDRLQGSTPVIENEKETKKAYKKNYGSTNLVSRKISSDFKNEKK